MERCKYYNSGCCIAEKNAPRVPCRGDKTECNTDKSVLDYEDVTVLIYKKSLIYVLKTYTTDFIKMYTQNDTFIVEFYYMGELSYTTTIRDIYTKIKDGAPTISIADKIIKEYKTVLLARHFK